MASTNSFTNVAMSDIASHAKTSLFATCEYIAQQAGMAFPSDISTKLETLKEIAAYAQFRFRKVLLTGDWWKTDNGPLLVFQKDSRKPLALIPSAKEGYLLVDITNSTSQKITRGLSASLELEAYYFYRLLPHTTLKLRDIWNFVFPILKGEIVKVALLAVFVGLLNSLVPIGTNHLFSIAIPNAALSEVGQWVFILFASSIGIMAFSFSQMIILMRWQFRANVSLQSAIWDRLLQLPLSFFRKFTAGDLTLRSMGIDQIQEALTEVVITQIISGILAIMPLILMVYYDIQLTLCVLLLMAIIISVYFFVYHILIKYYRDLLNLQGELSSTVLELLGSIIKIRTTSSEAQAYAHWQKKFSTNIKLFFNSNILQAKMTVFSAVMSIVSLMIIFAITYMQKETLSFGHFIGFYTAFGIFSSALFNLANTLLTALTILPLYERAKPILEAIPEQIHTGIDPAPITGEIIVKNIHFSYENDKPILNDISLEIHPGECVAIIGPSGSGKSTLIKLLLGLLKPQQGEIYYDRHEISTLNLRALRSHLGVALQNDSLLVGSIYENICGILPLTMDEAWQLARLVVLDKDIEAMPMGMQTIITENGKTLSGGTKTATNDCPRISTQT